MDEILRYAKYCSDDIELRHKKLKEKLMWAQMKAAQKSGNFVDYSQTGFQGKGQNQNIQNGQISSI